ncbi:MAG: rhodanese-like domain-containing protein [Gaiella sp.]
MRVRPSRVLLAVIAAALALAVVGCGDSTTADEGAATGTAASPVSLVPPVEARQVIEENEVEVLDVRTPEEFSAGHLAGATLIDFYEPDFEQRIDELDRDTAYVVYCRSGNRSGQAAALMRELGFTAVTDVDGGIEAWEAAGLPVER